MGKKTKQGKGRLDKYYHLAKEHGYRSRAAFKLIQMNKKYDFLSQAKCVVDLCAAPGGWLQVCSKYMPIASIKIGVDLDPIPPIKGCVTFKADITTQRCMALIKKELKHFKADVVLNDGAPNVGANWQMDAFNQIELSLHALRVATETLRKGGTFITKVFRSRDYNALMYVANQLFNKVESNKPQSSRQTSAEIFMVCTGYKAPDSIDPKLLDPKYALEEVDEDPAGNNDKITSLKKLLTQKKNRSGYANEDGKTQLYNECDLIDFLGSADPHEYLSTFNKFRLDDVGMKAIEDFKPPKDLQLICEDLKVCGRKEFSDLLKLRYKHGVEVERKKKEEKDSRVREGPDAPEEFTQEQLEAQVDKELEETIKRVGAEKKRTAKKQRELDLKQDMRKKMSIIAGTIQDDEDLVLDQKTMKFIKGLDDLEDVQAYLPKTEEDLGDEFQDPHEKKYKFLTDGGEAQESGDDESDVDDKVKLADRMAREEDDFLEQRKEYHMFKGKKEAKKEAKLKKDIDSHRQRNVDLSDDEKIDNKELMGQEEESENDDDLEEERHMEEAMEEAKAQILEKKAAEDEEEKQLFKNPLLALKGVSKKGNKKDEDSEEWSDDDKYEPKKAKKSAREEKKLLGKRKKGEDPDDVKDFFTNEPIQEVPVNDMENVLPDGYSSMDSDDIAETRALAKKMLRKKFRGETIDASYSRYAWQDNEDVVPGWFMEDEARNNVPNINLTQEEIDEEKRQLREWNARPSKKVTEAKARTKLRLAKAMNKVKNKAQVIASQDINEQSKMKQIQKMYTKEKKKHEEEKNYVVNRTFNSSQGKKVGRGVKMVDARMRADTRNTKIKKKSANSNVGRGKKKKISGKRGH